MLAARPLFMEEARAGDLTEGSAWRSVSGCNVALGSGIDKAVLVTVGCQDAIEDDEETALEVSAARSAVEAESVAFILREAS